MRKLKRYLILYLLCLPLADLYSQPSIDDDKAHRRYWFYRTRLINDFMKIGTEQGDCIISPERNNGSSSSNTFKEGPDNMDISNQYLIALALEYKILSRNNQSTAETVKEIYHILYMINRLDEEADQFWTTTPTQTLSGTNNTTENGFILREDMPDYYFNSAHNEKHFNYAMQEDGFVSNPTNLQTASYTGLNYANQMEPSAFHSVIQNDPNFAKKNLTLPAEKYYSMLTAFMFLIKYLPNGLDYSNENGTQYFPDGQSDIKSEIVTMANHIHHYLRGNVFNWPTDDWLMEYPDGTCWSGMGAPLPFSYPLTKMICKINGSYPWPVSCSGYGDAVSSSLGLAFYDIMQPSVLPGGGLLFLYNSAATLLNLIPGVQIQSLTAYDLVVMLAYCQAASNDPGSVAPLDEGALLFANASVNSVEWASLLRKVLHQDGLLYKQEQDYAGPIDVAPCKGPYNFNNPNDVPNIEWESQDRDEHQEARYSTSPVQGNYPGVDYMLLHNLYYEHLNQEDDFWGGGQTAAYKSAVNLMDNYDEQIWPISLLGNAIGTQAWPANIHVFQNLSSWAQIFATSSPWAPNNNIPSMIDYRAGKEIALLPEDGYHNTGFSLEEGSEFHAYIQRYLCSNGDYGNGLRQMPGAVSTDYESDAMNTQIAIHHVSHPLSPADLYPYGNTEAGSLPPNQQQSNKAKGSATTGTDLSQRFQVMPNPNNGLFKVEVSKVNDSEELTLTIVDMKGVVVFSDANAVSRDFDFTGYAKGIYLVQLKSSLGFTSSKKISVSE